ncbi:MAG: hypothetical protein IAE65_10415 [Ignavibacteria bacterium]|nr:hypothetical protein [Ignavibacteria bacterium]
MKSLILVLFICIFNNFSFFKYNCNLNEKSLKQNFVNKVDCIDFTLIDSLARDILNNRKVFVFHTNDTSKYLYVNSNNILKDEKQIYAAFYGNNVISIKTDRMDTLKLNSVYFKSIEFNDNSDFLKFYVDYYIKESLKKSLEFYYSIDTINCTLKLENLSVTVY